MRESEVFLMIVTVVLLVAFNVSSCSERQVYIDKYAECLINKVDKGNK